MKKTRLAVATKWLIDIIFFSGILVCAAVPWIIKIAGNYTFVFKEYYLQMVIVFIVAGIFADLIFFELRHMFRTILREDPFVMSNVVSLKRMGVYSFIIALCTITRLFIIITPAVLVVILVFAIAGLFSLVLAQVFEQAVNFKQENDLTI